MAEKSDAGESWPAPSFFDTVSHATRKENPMLRAALVLLVIAIIAAVLGFGGIAGAAAGIAKILFWVFVILLVLNLIFGRRIWR
jgi:uncharacterized membrane protein YtjA (UPF0391 family)